MAQKKGPKILLDLLPEDKQNFKSKTAAKGQQMQPVLRAFVKVYNADPDKIHKVLDKYLETA